MVMDTNICAATIASANRLETKGKSSNILYVTQERREMECNVIICQGKSSKFAPYAQKVGLNHQVADDDVVSSGC